MLKDGNLNSDLNTANIASKRCLLKDQETGVLHLAVHSVDFEAFIIRKLSEAKKQM